METAEIRHKHFLNHQDFIIHVCTGPQITESGETF